jgi:hypothetical protein
MSAKAITPRAAVNGLDDFPVAGSGGSPRDSGENLMKTVREESRNPYTNQKMKEHWAGYFSFE